MSNKAIWFLLFIFGFQFSFCQTSFLYELDIDSDFSAGFPEIEISKNKDLSFIQNNKEGFVLSPDLIQAFKVTIEGADINLPISPYSRKGNHHLISFNTQLRPDSSLQGICFLNMIDQIAWCRKTSIKADAVQRVCKISKSLDAYSFVSMKKKSEEPRKLNIGKYDYKSGEPKWVLNYESELNKDLNYFGTDLVELSDETIFLGFLGYLNEKVKSGFLKLNSDGEIIDNFIFANDSIRLFNTKYVTDTFDNIYVHGRILSQKDLELPNSKEGFIAKFDKDFEFIWAKRLSAENFNFRGITLNVFPNQEVLFAYYTSGDLPIISGKLDMNGNLVRHKGYSFFSPEIEIGLDSSVYFASEKKYFEDGSSERSIIIAKTDSIGEIENCPQFDACLQVFDLDIPLTKWTWIRDSIEPLPYLNFSIDTIDLTLTDHCGTPRPPTPYFTTPDTICQNECLRPDSLYNHLAHAVEWTITGNDVLFENRDTSFNYCFNQPGKYQIEQEVWLLGCSDFFIRELVVLPDSLGDLLGDNRMICDDSIAVLKPNTTRPIRDYQWNDGSNDSTLNISQSGNYALTISDGYCSANDAVEITFFDEWLSGIGLELPKDTFLCEELLPFTLVPKSDFSSIFFLNGNANPKSTFEINSGGSFQISTQIKGCEISKNFNLTLTPCEVDIYIPSSFSPNNDGINDLLEPLGNDFIGKKMTIYDRWGGKLFETKNPPFAWDGGKVEEGIYVLTFSYQNLRNNREEVISADVLVMR